MNTQTHTTTKPFPVKEHPVFRRPHRPLIGALAVAASLALAGVHLLAGTAIDTSKDVSKNPPVAPEKGPPLPLHEIEGNGGILTTLSAYIVNPPRNGEPVGRPAIGSGLSAWEMVGLSSRPLSRGAPGSGSNSAMASTGFRWATSRPTSAMPPGSALGTPRSRCIISTPGSSFSRRTSLTRSGFRR